MADMGAPNDRKLPQLVRALDGVAMRQVFDEAVRSHGAQRVTDCRVDRVKYRPGRNCTVSYRLGIHDERSGHRYEQLAAGRFCARGEAAARYAAKRSRVAVVSRSGISSLLVPGMELMAWFFPNDPELASLPALFDTVHDGGSTLTEVLAASTGVGAAPVDVRADVVQYVPESRACARFDMRLADGREERLYAKIERKNGGAITHALMQTLYDSPAQRDGRLRTPRPLLWQEATGLHWQAAVPGLPLMDVHPLCPPGIAARVGHMIAALHDTPVDLSRHSGGGGELGDRARECAAMLTIVQPAWAPALIRLLPLLEAQSASVRSLPTTTLHGDLHPRNIMLDGPDLYLIDLDGARRGPAVLELGAWVADGLYRALLAGTRLAAVQESVAHMLAAYRSDARHPVDGRLLAWATARALLCDRAYRSVANLKPGRLEIVPALLTLAALIAECGDLEQPLPEI